jgi:ammonia channel protein AmtB
MIAASASCITCILIRPLFMYSKKEPTKRESVVLLVNSIMAGCVSITASCNNVSLFSAIVIGFFGCILYLVFAGIYRRIEIDDPLEASIIHGVCGLWGVVAVGLFDRNVGLLYNHSFHQVKVQLIGAFAMATWSALITWVFVTLARRSNRFRVGEIFEIIGTDILDPHDRDLLEKVNKRQMGILISDATIAKIEQRQRNFGKDD